MRRLITLLIILNFSCEQVEAQNNYKNSIKSEEKNNINIFKRSINSVVNISPTSLLSSFYFNNRQEVPAGVGTGFVWDEEGHIVTNAHVVHQAYRVFISFYQDQKKYEAKLIGFDKEQDIAVLKVIDKPKNSLRSIEKGSSSNLQVGQKVFAIGSPFNLDYTMTTGIISALGRTIKEPRGADLHDMIQTDASINPGNSGGPLLDSQGKVIGINTAIYSTSGGNNGISFAIPIDTVKEAVPDLIRYGKIIRPIIGVQVENFRGPKGGVHIIKVFPRSAAEKAGLRGISRYNQFRNTARYGDIIISIDEKEVKNYSGLRRILSSYNPGDRVKITVQREDRLLDFLLNLDSNE